MTRGLFSITVATFLFLLTTVFVVSTGCRYTTSEDKKEEIKLKQAKLVMHNIIRACEEYRQDNGSFPMDLEYLFSTTESGKGKKSYLTSRVWLTDPWDTVMNFEASTNHVILSSAGPDKRWGTNDDVKAQNH